MIKPNIENSNSQLLANQKRHSNTHLFLHLPLTYTTNSFDSFLSTSNQAKIKLSVVNIHLDYLRISATLSTKKSFHSLLASLGLPIPNCENKILWYPHKKASKEDKYQNSLRSDKGIQLGYTKRLLNNSKKPKYVYDIMIDFYGSYFADLSLLKQINLINYLNTNYKLKCHRIDVAIDDYSRELFPLLQMQVAIEMGNYFGFTETTEEYLYCRSEGCIGTLPLGSRNSERYVRVYTVRQFFDRWEAELKRVKAQKLFDEIGRLAVNKADSSLPFQAIQKAFLDAALGEIDFRDKSRNGSLKNATRERTNRVPFWQCTLDKLYSSVETIANSNTARSISV